MEAKLTIKQRIHLINLLAPMTSSAAKRKLLDAAIMDLSMSEEEIKATSYTEAMVGNNLSFTYKVQFDPIKTIVFGDVVHKCLSDKLKELDAQEKIGIEVLPLYEIFVLT